MCEFCGCGKVTVEVGESVFRKNIEFSFKNRRLFKDRGVFVVNIIGSPGSGKTTLVEETCKRIGKKVGFLVGDLNTERDAERIKTLGIPSVQINTKGGCHLDAAMIGEFVKKLPLDEIEILFIENVGNLVCPTSFYLGEDLRVVVLSVAEGDEKPEKYPSAFYSSNALVITKLDLLPYVDFSLEKAVSGALSVNPHLRVFKTSSKTGEGLDAWVEYLESFGKVD